MDIQQFERATEIRELVKVLTTHLAEIRSMFLKQGVGLQFKSEFEAKGVELQAVFCPQSDITFMKQYCKNVSDRIAALEAEMEKL